MKNRFGVVVQPGTTRDQKMSGWRVFRPRFLQTNCIGDRSCELCCPDGAVYRIDKRKFDVDLDACKGCGICAEMCPVNDIVMEVEEQPEAGEMRHADESFPTPLDTASGETRQPGEEAGPRGEPEEEEGGESG